MTTYFMIYFYMPEEFEEDNFKCRLKKTFKKFGVEISNIEEMDTDIHLRCPGDLLNYSFETDYDFKLANFYESAHYDCIMNKMKKIVEYFNERNPEKLGINIEHKTTI